MTNERYLYIWSGPALPEDMSPLKTAKADLGIQELIRPVRIRTFEEYGAYEMPKLLEECERVLAIGSRPPWLVDYALVAERTSRDGWKAALAWSLGIVQEDPRATTVLDIVRATFGPGVREIPPEEIESEERLHNYLNRVE